MIKNKDMKFLINNATIEDRHTEPRIWNISEGMPMPAKHEEVAITINLTGSGDTRKFTNKMLLVEIMERLEVINAK